MWYSLGVIMFVTVAVSGCETIAVGYCVDDCHKQYDRCIDQDQRSKDNCSRALGQCRFECEADPPNVGLYSAVALESTGGQRAGSRVVRIMKWVSHAFSGS